MNYNIHAKVDLKRGNPQPRYERNVLMEVGDTLSHCWTVEVYDDGQAVDLTNATVTGFFTRADGNTVPVTGSASGNVATVITTGSVTAVQGDLDATMKITLSGVTLTVDAFKCTVRNDNNENYIDPGSVVPNLQELLAMVDECEDAADAAEAAAASIVSVDWSPTFRGGYTNLQGSIVGPFVENANYVTAIIPVHEGDVVTLCGAGGGAAARLYAMVDDQGSLVDSSYKAAANTSLNSTITIPAHVTQFVFNADATSTSYPPALSVASNVPRMLREIHDLQADAKIVDDTIKTARTLPIWEVGAISPSVGSDADNTTRLRTTKLITADSGIFGFTCASGYSARILKYKKADDTFIGVSSNSYGWTTNSSNAEAKSAWAFDFFVGGIEYYYRLVLQKTSDPDLTVADGEKVTFVVADWYGFDDKIADAVDTVGTENTVLNTSDYPVFNCIVRDSNLLTVADSGYQSVQIPIPKLFDKITVTAPAEKAAVVSLFKKALPYTITNGQNVTSLFATGEAGRHVISAGETDTFDIPSDTAYAIVHILSNSDSTVPASISVHNKLFKLPALPTTNGTYTLKCTVASGMPTLSWEA